MTELSHTDSDGRARMVDVGDKPLQRRVAKATGFIHLSEETVRLVRENSLKKGDVLTIAEVGGVQAAKRTAELIPLCHNIVLDRIRVSARLDSDGIVVQSEVRCIGKTGVEMEALTAVSVALLTVYDMCKAVDKSMTIDRIRLDEKTKTDISE